MIDFRTQETTKLAKLPIALLRLEGLVIAICKDDLITLGETYEESLTGNVKSVMMFLHLGFLRNPDKSTLLPSQETTYLGFIFNPANILLIVKDDKKEKIRQ